MAMRIKVNSEDHDIRLDRWFKRHHKEVSFTTVAKLIRKGGIKLDGKKAQVSTKVQEGQEISYPEFSEPETPRPKNLNTKLGEQLKNSVIYKDDNIIAINKPSGLAVQGGSKIKDSVDDLAEFLKFGYEDKPKLVHRLDKDTSGILIMARKTSVAAKLSEYFRNKNIDKKYLAVLCGTPRPLVGTIKAPLKKEYEDNFEKVRSTPKGTNAITEYEVLDYASDKLSLVEFTLITGKTHQLRAHSALIECPILGDEKYGGQQAYIEGAADKLHLHAFKMELELDGKLISLEAPIPEYFKSTLNTLGLSVKSS